MEDGARGEASLTCSRSEPVPQLHVQTSTACPPTDCSSLLQSTEAMRAAIGGWLGSAIRGLDQYCSQQEAPRRNWGSGGIGRVVQASRPHLSTSMNRSGSGGMGPGCMTDTTMDSMRPAACAQAVLQLCMCMLSAPKAVAAGLCTSSPVELALGVYAQLEQAACQRPALSIACRLICI